MAALQEDILDQQMNGGGAVGNNGQPGFKVPSTIDTIDHARYINRLNQATLK